MNKSTRNHMAAAVVLLLIAASAFGQSNRPFQYKVGQFTAVYATSWPVDYTIRNNGQTSHTVYILSSDPGSGVTCPASSSLSSDLYILQSSVDGSNWFGLRGQPYRQAGSDLIVLHAEGAYPYVRVRLQGTGILNSPTSGCVFSVWYSGSWTSQSPAAKGDLPYVSNGVVQTDEYWMGSLSTASAGDTALGGDNPSMRMSLLGLYLVSLTDNNDVELWSSDSQSLAFWKGLCAGCVVSLNFGTSPYFTARQPNTHLNLTTTSGGAVLAWRYRYD